VIFQATKDSRRYKRGAERISVERVKVKGKAIPLQALRVPGG
jgi:hypothetical protein